MKKPEPLQLQRISVFMPQRLRDDEVERIFIMRQDVFHTLLDSIKSEKATSIPQHHLIIGQRGMGKTTLLKRLDVELRKVPLNKKLIPFTFPEEQYNIDRLSKFWLNSLDALADTLQTEGDEKMAFQLDEQIAELSAIRNEQELSQKAFESLRDTTKALGRRPVFLLDNLNLIFDRLGEVEQSKLRKLITEPGAPIFIGASPEAFDEDLQYDAPFYDAFAVHFLYKLDFRQTLTMLRHLGEITNQTTLLSQLNAENMPRLETLHALTGGNVRTVVILFSLVAQGFSADVFQDLEALIDQMTPLYKSRFEELSTQAQVVVDAIALNWDPCKLETLRERTSLENNQLSVQLDRLAKAGWITKLGKRKAANYEISERFFNVWYLMRRATRRQRRDLLWLTRFLQAWFTRPELVKQAKAFMRDVHEREKEYELAYGLALARALPNQTGERLKRKIYQRLLKIVEGDVSRLEEMVGVNMDEVSEEIIHKYNTNESSKLVVEGDRKYGTDNINEAEEKYRAAIKANLNNDDAWERLGSLLLEINRPDDALQAFKRTIEINKENIWGWIGLIFSYWENAPDEARKTIEEALMLLPKSENLWEIYLELAVDKNVVTDVIKIFQRAIDTLPEKTIFKTSLADLLAEKGKNSEAERMYKKAIVESRYGSSEVIRYRHYLVDKGRYNEVEKLFQRALEKNKSDASIPDWYASFLVSQNRVGEAESMYTLALERSKKSKYKWEQASILHSLGKLYHYRMKRYIDAEKMYKKAIALKDYSYHLGENLVALLADKMGRLAEAKTVFHSMDLKFSDKDEILLRKALFAAYDNNKADFYKLVYDAIGEISEEKKMSVEWRRFAATAIHLSYGEQLQSVFRETGHDRIFRPFYEAIKALTLNSEEYLKTEVAAEVREVALQIFKFMQDYNAPVSQEIINK